MNYRFIYFYIITLFIFLFTGCEKENDTTEKQAENFQQGTFSMMQIADPSQLEGAKKSGLDIKKVTKPGFDLGEIKASKEYYFILLNTGSSPIFNISLQSSNENFKLHPTNINTLLPFDDTKNLDINLSVPIITVSVEHGVRLNGIGYTAPLDTGLHITQIDITGETLIMEDSVIDISYAKKMQCYAKVMNIEIYADGNPVDLFTPIGTIDDEILFMGEIPFYPIREMEYTTIYTIKNTGNTSINAGIFGISSNMPLIIPGDSATFTNVESGYVVYWNNNHTNGGDQVVVKIDADGAIGNPEKFRFKQDGNAYFSLYKER